MQNIVVLVRQEGLGQVGPEDKQFGLEMLDKYFHALEGQPVKPRAICFYTDGVKLVCEGSPVVFSLRLLEGMGVRILACKSCLDRLGLSDRVASGDIVGMNDIVELTMSADKVITV
jgi:sulfur relay (sulfurtransferase) complex TusBCD TusD component (DsrE family)